MKKINEINSMLSQQLQSNNKGNNDTLDNFICNKCNNRGYTVFTDNEGGDYAIDCECAKTKMIKNNIERSGMKSIIDTYNFDSFEDNHSWQKLMKNKAKEFISNQKENWFFIGGQVGSGKTHICIAICNHLIKIGFFTRYIIWRDFINELKHTMSNNESSISQVIKKINSVDVLFIDDLFKSGYEKKPTIFELEILSEILDYRYRNRKTTIINSELDINEIISIDESIGSRIYEMAKDFSLDIPKDSSKNIRLIR